MELNRSTMTNEIQQLYSEFMLKFKPPDSFCVNYIDDIDDIDDVIDLPGWGFSSTMLIIASYYGDINIVKKCIKLGADVNKMNITDRNALFFSISNGKYEITKLLLKAGADPNIRIKTYGNTNVPMIFYLYHCTGIKELIKYGALLNEFYICREFIQTDSHMYFIKILAKRRWVTIKCVTLILGIHKRAVVTANHPERLLEQGYFQEL